MKRLMIWSLVLIVLIGALPVISAFAASAMADALGCRLDEGSVQPCTWGGIEIGDALYTMFVLHWLGLATIPFAAVALAVWLVVALILLVLRWSPGGAA